MSDWGGLAGLIRASAEDLRRERARGPVACPYDGEPLVERDGIRHCPWGDYEWRGVDLS